MKTNWNTTFLYLLFFQNLITFSQEPVYKHYSIEDGLPSTEIYDIFQDSKGYIWIGSYSGVTRFNGYFFQNFTMDDGLADNNIMECSEDEKGRIWFTSISCKLSYFENNSFTPYKYNDKIAEKLHDYPIPFKRNFFINKQDSLIYSINQIGILSVSPDGQIFIDSSTTKLHIKLDNTNNVWFQRHFKYQTSDTNKKIKISPFYSVSVENQKESKNYTISIPRSDKYSGMPFYGLIGQNNHLFYGNSIFLCEYKDSILLHKIEFKDRVIFMGLDKKNTLWVGIYNNGIFGYKNQDISHPFDYHLLQGKSVSSMIQDGEGSYWFSTLGDGIYYSPSLEFISYDNNTLLTGKITRICSQNQGIWIVKGMNVFYLEEGKIYPSKGTGFTSSQINSVYCLPNSTSILLATSHGLIKHTLGKHCFKKENCLKAGFPYTGNLEIKKGKNNTFLVSSIGGFCRLNNQYQVIYNSQSDGFSKKVTSLEETNEDETVWLGTDEGLWQYKNKQYTFLGEKKHLLKYKITNIQYNNFDDKLWIATKGIGIVIKDKDKLVQISQKQGLSSNSIDNICLDSNIVWAATNKGISKIELLDTKLLKYVITVINKDNGLTSDEVYQTLVNDTMLWIATDKSIMQVKKNNIKKNNIPPLLYIKNISINNNDTLLLSKYILPHDKNNIKIDFEGLSYKSAGKIIYKYKLEGLHSGYNTTINRNIQFFKLLPGNYHFILKALNEDGHETEKPVQVTFHILKPFWQTWWFKTIVFITIIMSTTGIFLFRIKEINRQNTLKHDLLSNRQHALTKQMNPHFLFNTLNSIQSFILENQKDAAILYLGKFAGLMRMVLDHSRYNLISINNEINALQTYLELESSRFKFDFTIQIDKRMDTNMLKIPPLLIQPFAENAILHGLVHKNGYKKISICLNMGEQEIFCIIEDNGIGRDKAMKINYRGNKHKSLATIITNDRIDVINAVYKSKIKIEYIDLIDDEKEPAGTKVILNLPILT